MAFPESFELPFAAILTPTVCLLGAPAGINGESRFCKPEQTAAAGPIESLEHLGKHRSRLAPRRAASATVFTLPFGVKAIQRIREFYVDPATALVIKHDDGRRPVDGDFRNVPTVGEIIAQAQFASGRKGESGFAIRCPDDASPTAFCIRVVVVKSLRSQ